MKGICEISLLSDIVFLPVGTIDYKVSLVMDSLRGIQALVDGYNCR